MGWDEQIFGWFFRAATRFTRAPQGVEVSENILRRLAVVASAVGGPIDVVTVDGPGGHLAGRIELPRRFAPSSIESYVLKILLARTLFAAVSLTNDEDIDETVSPDQRTARHAHTNSCRLNQEFEHAALVIGELILPGELVEIGGATTISQRDLLAARYCAKPPAPGWPWFVSPWLSKPGTPLATSSSRSRQNVSTQRESARKARVVRMERPKEQENENPVIHSFEKVQTAEEYGGGARTIDGSDEMDEHGEALDELTLDRVIRSDDPTGSLYRADVTVVGEMGGVESIQAVDSILYPEWDGRRGKYLEKHCSVRVLRPGVDPSGVTWVRTTRATHRTELYRLIARFSRLERNRRIRPRELCGAEIDIDAVVANRAMLRSGYSSSERLYTSHRPHLPTLRVSLLLDISLSTDAWVDGHRVLDLVRTATVLLAEAMEEIGIRFEISAFCSQTRSDCRFFDIKRADESWLSEAGRLLSLEPTGYTRIGPALRHATHLFDHVEERRKLLLVLSDGKPTDDDHYDGRHGTLDVQRAIREAKERGITTFAFVVEKHHRAELNEMFGQGGHAAYKTPTELLLAVGTLLARLAR